MCISLTVQMSFWVKDLDLRYSDKAIIEEGEKLSDRHMYAAHKLLSGEFPSLEGLQSTLLAETGGFLPVNGTQGGFFPEGLHCSLCQVPVDPCMYTCNSMLQ